MRITKKSTTQYGVFYKVSDDVNSFWVTEEGLRVKMVFDQLIAEGYKIYGLPADLRIDGSKIVDLGSDETPSEEQMELAFKMSDAEKYTDVELLGMIPAGASMNEDMPTDYSIHTQEELIDYIEHMDQVGFIPYPTNYFVAPEARFTPEQLKCDSDVYAYVQKLYSRMQIGIRDYLSLKANLVKLGMKENPTAFEFMDFYHKWGVDGLNVEFTYVENTTTEIDGRFVDNGSTSTEGLYEKELEIAMIDKYSNIYRAGGKSAAGWSSTFRKGNTDPNFKNLISSLPTADHRGCLIIKKNCERDIKILAIPGLKVHISESYVSINDSIACNFAIHTDDATRVQIMHYLYNSNNNLKNYEKLASAAGRLIELNKVVTNASSSLLFQKLGYDAVASLSRFAEDFNDTVDNELMTGSKSFTEVDRLKITERDITDFLMEESAISQDKATVLQNAFDGVMNIGAIASADAEERKYSAFEVANSLWAIHTVMGVPINEIIESVHKLGEGDNVLQFTKDGAVSVVAVPKLDYVEKTFYEELKYEKLRAHEEASIVYKIIAVAYEFSNGESDRHVGAEICYFMRGNGATWLDFKKAWVDFVMATAVARNVSAGTLKGIQDNMDVIINKGVFDVEATGACRIPGIAEPVMAPEKLHSACRMRVSQYAVSTMDLANISYRNGTYSCKCINATVMPTRVIPNKGESIPYLHFFVLWKDVRSKMANYNQLVEIGQIPRRHIPWTVLIANSPTWDTISSLSLQEYARSAFEDFSNTPLDCDFVRASFRMDDYQSLIYSDGSAQYRSTSTPRGSGVAPSLDAKPKGFLEYDENFEKLEITKLDETGKILPFNGTRFEYIYMKDGVFNTDALKHTPGKGIVVLTPTTILTNDHDGPFPISQIEDLIAKGYPVVNPYGRYFIFMDNNSTYYEVTV